jgi:hypothetical protein
MNYIYGLIDPFTFKIRYIGKTANLRVRINGHMSDKEKTYKTNWIKELLKAGKRPIMVVIRKLPDTADWQIEERKWIAIARKYKWPLVNCTEGGSGIFGLSGPGKERKNFGSFKGKHHTLEAKQKNRLRHLGAKAAEKTKDKMSIAHKGRKITWSEKLKESSRKLDSEKVQEIVFELNNGMKGIQVAEKYNLHRTTVSKIKMGTYFTYKQKVKNHVKPRRHHSPV